MATATKQPAACAANSTTQSDGLIDVRLTDIRFAAQDTNLYEFRRVDGAALPAYEPGAHVDMHLPNGMTRQYSLVIPDPKPESYVFSIKRDAASRGGSRYIHDELHAGATLRVSRPRNNFPLAEDAEHVVLFAGGIGITPIWCMVQRLGALGRSWKLHYACRSRADMAFLQSLEKYEAKYFHLHFDDESGQVIDIAAAVAGAPKSAHLYCCGPEPMLKAFEAATASWPRPQVHVEYFTAKAEPATQGGFWVELARSNEEYFIPPGKTILQVLYEAGVDVDYSCELGICGACETKVISGIPEHRNSVLSEDEQAANTKVMICCAGCKSDRLVLDM